MTSNVLDRAAAVAAAAKLNAEMRGISLDASLWAIVTDPQGGCDLPTAAALYDAKMVSKEFIARRIHRELNDVLLVLNGTNMRCAMLQVLAEQIGVAVTLPEINVPHVEAPGEVQ